MFTLSAPIQSAEVSSSADGIELLSTDSDGLFSGISATGGGAVDSSQFDGLIIGVTLDAGLLLRLLFWLICPR